MLPDALNTATDCGRFSEMHVLWTRTVCKWFRRIIGHFTLQISTSCRYHLGAMYEAFLKASSVLERGW